MDLVVVAGDFSDLYDGLAVWGEGGEWLILYRFRVSVFCKKKKDKSIRVHGGQCPPYTAGPVLGVKSSVSFKTNITI
jgi:hypothetical protein